MEKNSASQEVLEGYLEDDENWESANLLFCLLATCIEDRTVAENRKSPTKKKKKGKKGASNLMQSSS